MQKINLFSLIEKEETYTKNFANNDLTRLVQEKTSNNNSIELSLKGKIANNHNKKLKLLDIEIKGEIQLICQRCNNIILHQISIKNTLEIFSNLEKLNKIDVTAENYDSIIGSDDFDVQELLEEEILLNLPLFPMHEICPQHDYHIKPEQTHSPFAILAKLKDANK